MYTTNKIRSINKGLLHIEALLEKLRQDLDDLINGPHDNSAGLNNREVSPDVFNQKIPDGKSTAAKRK